MSYDETAISELPDLDLARAYADVWHSIRNGAAPADLALPYGDELDRRIRTMIGGIDLFQLVFMAIAVGWRFDEHELAAREAHERGDVGGTVQLYSLLLILAGRQRLHSDEEAARLSEAEALSLLGRLVDLGYDDFLDDYQFLKSLLPADVIEDAETFIYGDQLLELCGDRRLEPEVEMAEWRRAARDGSPSQMVH